jgi:N-acetylneuraminic acid mutarotase
VSRFATALALLACVVAACGNGSASTTRWTALRKSLVTRSEIGAARIGPFAYVAGGFTNDAAHPTTAAVERYDLDSDRWKRVHDMPVPLNHTVAAAYKGDLYVMGGYSDATGLSKPVATLYRYNPTTDHWSTLPSAPSARAAHTMGVIGDRLYVTGGARAGKPLKTLEIYDFKTRKWSSGPSMRTAREHLTGAVTGGFFYVLAGRAVGKGNFKVAERYDPRKRRWQQLPDMKKARGGIACAVVNGRIVVFGGEESAGTIARVERYDPASRKWTRLPDMRTPRHGLGGVSRKGRVYAIEGGRVPGFHFSNLIEALDVR